MMSGVPEISGGVPVFWTSRSLVRDLMRSPNFRTVDGPIRQKLKLKARHEPLLGLSFILTVYKAPDHSSNFADILAR